MKKTIAMIVLLCVAFTAPGVWAAPAKEQVTQGELAAILVNVLGLARFLPAAPTPYECAEVLALNGIQPKDGWNVDKVVTKADLARVIVLAMKRGDEVKNPDSDKSWVDFLASLGVNIDSIGQAADSLRPLAEPVVANVFKGGSQTDPLKDSQEFGEPDSPEFGTDANVALTYVALQQILQEVEFPPVVVRPMTPN
ncbi:MAG: hypothetical protein PHD86_04240 [Kiritimatiellae bacterium]|nr:hypothetical protein [Kiritimatiellia bacterium]